MNNELPDETPDETHDQITESHFEKDEEMLAVLNDNVTHQYYISQMYKTLYSIYTDVVYYSKKCETLTFSNELLQQRVFELETTAQFDSDIFNE